MVFLSITRACYARNTCNIFLLSHLLYNVDLAMPIHLLTDLCGYLSQNWSSIASSLCDWTILPATRCSLYATSDSLYSSFCIGHGEKLNKFCRKPLLCTLVRLNWANGCHGVHFSLFPLIFSKLFTISLDI
jgi:hypothetical protein